MLEVRNLHVTRGKASILEDISFQPEPGKLYAVIGPNGAGKSTLLKAIAGQCTVAAGQVCLHGQPLGHDTKARHSALAFMPQDISLEVDLSAVEVVLLGQLVNLNMHVDDTLLDLALSALETVGLLHLANRSVATLSGGQRQMVLFAQLLMRKSPVLLLDEPVSALDLKHQIKLLDILLHETHQRQCTTLTVLHDLNLVAQYADEVLVIHDRGIAALGSVIDIMTAEFIRNVYGIGVDVMRGQDGLLRITPLRGTSKNNVEFQACA